MSDVSSPVSKDSPLRKAWDAWQATEDFANSRKWARQDQHLDGSLWNAFMQGFLAAGGKIDPPRA